MTSRKGFTLIELMVVIFIVGILAAVAIPIMRGRIDAAKWSEGKAAAGSVRTAIRALVAEKGNAWFNTNNVDNDFQALGFAVGDLTGKYFNEADYGFTISYVSDILPPTYTITVGPSTAADGPTSPASVQLTDAGTFTDL